VAVIAVATAGNVLGSLVNYGLGRYLQLYRGRRWFPVSDEALRRGEQHYRRFGRWSLLASWMPFVGDPLTLIAGVLRERIGVFLLLVTLAKGGRYVVLAVLAGSVQGFFSAAV
jgi:membrane protein YqaA with SNARE-associated domain